MKMSEAMVAIEKGLKIRHETWRDTDYVYKLGNSLINSRGSKELELVYRLDGWFLFIKDEVKEQGHDFDWALSQVKLGKQVKRKAPGNYYTYLSGIIQVSDLIATDWILG